MDKTLNKDLEKDLADAIIDRPYGFTCGNRHFYLYPVTLGKMFLLGRLIKSLGINEDILKTNPYLEAIRLVKEHREQVIRIITYHTIRTKAKIFDYEYVEARNKYLSEHCDDEDLETLLITVLTSDKTEAFMHHLKLDKEQERMNSVMKVKSSKNVYVFGGLSIYGSLIDAACSKYHWTFDYVVWEISYTNLKLLLADATKDICLSDDERKRCSVTNDRDRLSADDPRNWEKIKAEFEKESK